ncbi:MAG TPA: HEAT repeat domain-containing protein [Myxococcota bacterium]|nr:HEAT repeat domain-containing protein [Myxococcota bacterium]
MPGPEMRSSWPLTATMLAVTSAVALMTVGCGCGSKKKEPPKTPESIAIDQISACEPGAVNPDWEYLERAWETDDERQILELLSRAHTAEKAWRIIRKDPPAHLELLKRATRSRNHEIRSQALIIMGLLKSDNTEESLTSVMGAMMCDDKQEVRAIAAKTFVQHPTPASVRLLLKSLELDPFAGTRANAAWALGAAGDLTAVNGLRKATRDDDAFVRLRAVGALMDLKTKLGIPELIDRLVDENPMVAERAHQALREITGTDKGKNPDEWRRVFGKPLEDNLPTPTKMPSGTGDSKVNPEGYKGEGQAVPATPTNG